jgi:hypothetical protein
LLPDRGLPFVAAGLSYAEERLRLYSRISPAEAQGVDPELAMRTLQSIQRFALVAHRRQPFTSFPGLNPIQPDLHLVQGDEALDLILEVPMAPSSGVEGGPPGGAQSRPD